VCCFRLTTWVSGRRSRHRERLSCKSAPKSTDVFDLGARTHTRASVMRARLVFGSALLVRLMILPGCQQLQTQAEKVGKGKKRFFLLTESTQVISCVPLHISELDPRGRNVLVHSLCNHFCRVRLSPVEERQSSLRRASTTSLLPAVGKRQRRIATARRHLILC
jgi:hypothetical protein